MANPTTPARLHREIGACTLCVEAGYLAAAAPVLSGYADNRMMLVGQAPGAVEAVRRLPFQGRSGKVLMAWMERAGFASEEQVRRRVYMTSITKCFPGKGTGGGDRRPSRAEVDLCRPHLDRQLTPVRPLLVPLPHPSGASRWLNAPENRALLDRALRRLRPIVRALLDGQLAGA